MQTLLAILTAILGEDNDTLGRINAEPGDVEPTRWADYDGADETLAAFADVTDDEIRAAYDAIRAAAQEADGADLAGLVEAGQTLAFVIGARTEDETLAEEARAEALAALDENAPTASDPEPEPEPEDPDEPEAEPAETAEQQPEPVSARQPSIANMANRVPRPRQPLPTQETAAQAQDGARFTLSQAVSTPGGGTYRSGQEIGWDELGDVVAATMDKRSGGRQTVAQRLTHYPDDQRLGSDLEQNTARVRAAQQAMLSHEEPLMAAVCAPPTPIYEQRVISTTERPVQGFLPAFQATRGGVTFRPGLSFTGAGAVNNANSGVGIWTNANDITPSDPSTKPTLVVACPDPETATISAITQRAEISILQNRFDPESVAAALRRQDAFWARTAENNLLNTIETNSLAISFDAVLIIGFARHFLLQVNQLAAGIRNRERMAPDAPLDLLAPAWIVQAVQDDLTLEQPGSAEERLATTQAQLENWLAVRNVRVGWFLDGDFTFGAQTNATELADYPQHAEMYMFEPGHHLFLDGGSLNIDTFYDSTLLDTNKSETFFESFEAVASVGVVSYTLDINVCRTGTSGAGAEITCGEVS